jgi:hypothetical protein
MQDFLQSKAMAKALRQALAERKITLSHGECLELIARQFGLPDWNVLAARIQAMRQADPKLALPEGWFATGNTDLAKYRLGLDRSSPGTALIESRFDRDGASETDLNQFACMMQSIVADDYRGSKIRLTASLRTENADLGTIWLRIDKEPGSVLRFDNMMERPSNGAVKGTTGWTERSIVLDLPHEATSIHYGFFLKGSGRVWARNFRLDAVDHDIASTDIPKPRKDSYYLPKPSNLDFSQPGK